jgi:hypothetical protein
MWVEAVPKFRVGRILESLDPVLSHFNSVYTVIIFEELF